MNVADRIEVRVSGVLIGFGVVGSLILLGFVVGRMRLLPDNAERVLSMVAFTLGTPALMFYLLSTSRIDSIFSVSLATVAIAALFGIAVFAIVAAVARWGVPTAVVGGLASGYVNAGNLGLPVATYVLGSATLIAPVMLFQLIILAPVSMAILDIASGVGQSIGQRLLRPFRNPIVVASLAGVAVSASGLVLPDAILEPFSLLGHATVPIMLLAFGMGLQRHGLPLRRGAVAQTLVAVVLKSFAAPIVATIVGTLVFGLAGKDLMAAVLCASLPTAQNVYVYASRYESATTLARDAVSLTTVLAVPVLVVGSVLLPALFG
ncbi:MAG: AEC family transporter [Microbacterium ginsengisoli]|uniref:AEC family transporter n=1 Tax=Microbacterium TaxID=33882 RepID=UPI001910CC6F|nr:MULTISPECIES: AEC family transporter [unclassified Microbacterium]MBN9199578.1 AEC family transporter [Microbacterium ginsengisoli]